MLIPIPFTFHQHANDKCNLIQKNISKFLHSNLILSAIANVCANKENGSICPFLQKCRLKCSRPRLICQYSNMAPRLSEQTSICGVVFFVSKSLLGIEKQKKLQKLTVLTRKPRNHVAMLIFWTWLIFNITLGGAVASWLVRSSPDRAVRVRALAGDIVLCSCARHLTLTVPLSTQVYKWVPANLILGGNPAMDWHPIQGGVEILLVASCHGNRS